MLYEQRRKYLPIDTVPFYHRLQLYFPFCFSATSGLVFLYMINFVFLFTLVFTEQLETILPVTSYKVQGLSDYKKSLTVASYWKKKNLKEIFLFHFQCLFSQKSSYSPSSNCLSDLPSYSPHAGNTRFPKISGPQFPAPYNVISLLDSRL